MIQISKVAIVLVPLLLAACSSVPTQPQQPQSNKQKAPVSVMDDVSESIDAPKAVLSLIKGSKRQIKQGDLKGARRTLERAVRISPRYPDSYYYLAKVNYLEGRYKQARSLAKKSLSLGAEDTLLDNILVLIDDIDNSEAQ